MLKPNQKFQLDPEKVEFRSKLFTLAQINGEPISFPQQVTFLCKLTWETDYVSQRFSTQLLSSWQPDVILKDGQRMITMTYSDFKALYRPKANFWQWMKKFFSF